MKYNSKNELEEKEEKFSYEQIESIFSSILHDTDFPILLKSVGRQEFFSSDEWLNIFFEKLEKEVKWPQ